MNKKLQTAQTWLRLRKNSVIAHWLWGSVCGYVSHLNFVASLALLGIFAGFEIWNDRNHGTHEGDLDWWDAFFVYGIWFSVILILAGCGKISIRWF